MEKQRAHKPWARWLSGALATAMAVTLLPNIPQATLTAEAAIKTEGGDITVNFTAGPLAGMDVTNAAAITAGGLAWSGDTNAAASKDYAYTCDTTDPANPVYTYTLDPNANDSTSGSVANIAAALPAAKKGWTKGAVSATIPAANTFAAGGDDEFTATVTYTEDTDWTLTFTKPTNTTAIADVTGFEIDGGNQKATNTYANLIALTQKPSDLYTVDGGYYFVEAKDSWAKSLSANDVWTVKNGTVEATTGLVEPITYHVVGAKHPDGDQTVVVNTTPADSTVASINSNMDTSLAKFTSAMVTTPVEGFAYELYYKKAGTGEFTKITTELTPNILKDAQNEADPAVTGESTVKIYVKAIDNPKVLKFSLGGQSNATFKAKGNGTGQISLDGYATANDATVASITNTITSLKTIKGSQIKPDAILTPAEHYYVKNDATWSAASYNTTAPSTLAVTDAALDGWKAADFTGDTNTSDTLTLSANAIDKITYNIKFEKATDDDAYTLTTAAANTGVNYDVTLNGHVPSIDTYEGMVNYAINSNKGAYNWIFKVGNTTYTDGMDEDAIFAAADKTKLTAGGVIPIVVKVSKAEKSDYTLEFTKPANAKIKSELPAGFTKKSDSQVDYSGTLASIKALKVTPSDLFEGDTNFTVVTTGTFNKTFADLTAASFAGGNVPVSVSTGVVENNWTVKFVGDGSSVKTADLNPTYAATPWTVWEPATATNTLDAIDTADEMKSAVVTNYAALSKAWDYTFTIDSVQVDGVNKDITPFGVRSADVTKATLDPKTGKAVVTVKVSRAAKKLELTLKNPDKTKYVVKDLSAYSNFEVVNSTQDVLVKGTLAELKALTVKPSQVFEGTKGYLMLTAEAADKWAKAFSALAESDFTSGKYTLETNGGSHTATIYDVRFLPKSGGKLSSASFNISSPDIEVTIGTTDLSAYAANTSGSNTFDAKVLSNTEITNNAGVYNAGAYAEGVEYTYELQMAGSTNTVKINCLTQDILTGTGIYGSTSNGRVIAKIYVDRVEKKALAKDDKVVLRYHGDFGETTTVAAEKTVTLPNNPAVDNTTKYSLNSTATKAYNTLYSWAADNGTVPGKKDAGDAEFVFTNGAADITPKAICEAIPNKVVAEQDGSGAYVLDLYAVWTPTSYKVIYDANGGKNAGGEKKLAAVAIAADVNGKVILNDNDNDNANDSSTNVFANPDTTNPGYEFKGWAKTADAKEIVEDVIKEDGHVDIHKADISKIFAATAKKDDTVTLYAVWEPAEFTVTYVAGLAGSGATFPKPEDPAANPQTYVEKYKYLAGYKITDVKPSREEYTFVGWSTGDAAATVEKHKIKEDATHKIAKEIPANNTDAEYRTNKTFYAIWEPEYFAVDFNLNYKNADVYADKVEIPNGAGITAGSSLRDVLNVVNGDLGAADPIRAGYEFTGWFTTKEAADAFVPGTTEPSTVTGPFAGTASITDTGIKAATTFYAGWAEYSYEITYASDKGTLKEGKTSEDRTITVKYSDSVKPLDPTTLWDIAGWTFDYWYINTSAKEYELGKTTKVADLVTDGVAHAGAGQYVAPASSLVPGRIYLNARYNPGKVRISFANLTSAEEQKVRAAINANATNATLAENGEATLTKTSTVVNSDVTTLVINAPMFNTLRAGYTLEGLYFNATSDATCTDDNKLTGATDHRLQDYIAKGADFTLYPKYESKKYYVVFTDTDANGNPETTEEIELTSSNYGESLGSYATKKTAGGATFKGNTTLSFVGWRFNSKTWTAANTWQELLSDASTESALAGSAKGAPVSLVGRFDDDYQVIFEYVNGTEKDTRAAQSISKLDKLPTDTFTKANAKLTGWYVGTATSTVYEAGVAVYDDITASWAAGKDGAITLHPVFEDLYTIIFTDENGKTLKKLEYVNNATNRAKKITELSELTALDVKKAGYTFDGFTGKGTTKYTLTALISALDSEFGSGTSKVYSITLKANYTAGKYKVAFYKEPGSLITTVEYTTDVAAKLIDGTDVKTYASAKKQGMTVASWNTNQYGTGTSYANAAEVKNLGDVNATVVLYAVYTGKTYAITLDPNEAQLKNVLGTKFETKIVGKSSTTNVVYSTSATLPASPFSASGMKFEGWSLTNSATATKAYDDKAVIADNATLLAALDGATDGKLTLYGVWSVANYKITYVTNSSTPMESTTYTSEKEVVLANPTNADKHYTFEGWFSTATMSSGSMLKKNAAGSFIIPKGSAGDITVYALWKAGDVTITFKANNDSTTADKTQKTKYMTATKLSKNSFSKKGYVFGGWHLGSATGATIYNNEQELTAAEVNGDLTLYADWKKAGEEFKITLTGVAEDELPAADRQTAAAVGKYVWDGAKNQFTSTYVYGQKASLPTPTRENYVFGGWKDLVTKKIVKEITAKTTQNLTLEAQWTGKDLTVTWDSNASQVTTAKVTGTMKPTTVKYNDAVKWTTTGSYKANGWELIGWSQKAGKDALMPAKTDNLIDNLQKDITLYAVWREIPYYLDVTTYGGKISADGYVDNGAQQNQHYTATYYLSQGKTVVPATPVRDGYTFQGWFTSVDANGAYKGKVKSIKAGKVKTQAIHAKWAADVTINFYGEDEVTVVGTQVVPMKSFNSAVALAKIVPTKKDHIFTGWGLYTDNNAEGFEYTLTPQFIEKQKITVGDYFSKDDNEDQNGVLNTTGSSAGAKVTLNLYAKFQDATKSIYNVRLHHNNGTGTVQTIRYNVREGISAKDLKSYAPSYAYGKFSYWSTTANNKKFKVSSIGKKAVGDLDLYAAYTSGKAKIVYDYSNAAKNPAGFKGKTVKQSVTIGKEVAAKKFNLKAPGYTLLGWTYDADKAGVYNWKEISPAYDVNGDRVIADTKAPIAEDAEKRDGFVFEENAFKNAFDIATLNKGEKIQYGAGSGYNKNEFARAANKDAAPTVGAANWTALDPGNTLTNTVYPIWVANEYTIIVDMNGGQWPAGSVLTAHDYPELYYAGTDTVRNYTKADGDFQVPYRSGYTFTGWKIQSGTDKNGKAKWAKLGKAGIFNLKYVTNTATIQPQWKLNK